MDFEVVYRQKRRVGGTPESESLKEFTRLGFNALRYSGEINSLAGLFFKGTPCLQHEISCLVTLRGDPPFDSYRCEVILERNAKEFARRRAPARNSVVWGVTDHTLTQLVGGQIRIAEVGTGLDREVAITKTYRMEIDHGKETLVSSTSIVGGLLIPAFHFVTLLRDVRRVEAKVTIEYVYTVFPLGGYRNNPDGTKEYTPFEEVKLVIRSGEHLVSEEPDFVPEVDVPDVAEPQRITYRPRQIPEEDPGGG